MYEAVSSDERGWAILGIVNLILVAIAAIRVSDGTPYRHPFSWRLVK